MRAGMINVNVAYPGGEGKTFDMEYYLGHHIPMVRELLSPALQDSVVDKGLGGAQPGTPPAFMAVLNMYFNSLEDWQRAFGPVAEKIMSDIPNYTNTEPQIQINAVVA